MSTVMSPKTTAISVLGQTVNVPTNISLPSQTVTYVFPVPFNKPDYTTFVRNNGQYVLSVTHGNFPLSQVAGDIRAGKTIFDEINYMTFVEGSQSPITVNGNAAGANLIVNQTAFSTSAAVQAPVLTSSRMILTLATKQKTSIFSDGYQKVDIRSEPDFKNLWRNAFCFSFC